MSDLKVTQRKSLIGGNKAQRDSMRSLGLKRIGDSVVQPDRPEIRGMINAVAHLVEVDQAGAADQDQPTATATQPDNAEQETE